MDADYGKADAVEVERVLGEGCPVDAEERHEGRGLNADKENAQHKSGSQIAPQPSNLVVARMAVGLMDRPAGDQQHHGGDPQAAR